MDHGQPRSRIRPDGPAGARYRRTEVTMTDAATASSAAPTTASGSRPAAGAAGEAVPATVRHVVAEAQRKATGSASSGVKVFVDPQSAGPERRQVDYVDAAGYRLRSEPKRGPSCGCGKSFETHCRTRRRACASSSPREANRSGQIRPGWSLVRKARVRPARRGWRARGPRRGRPREPDARAAQTGEKRATWARRWPGPADCRSGRGEGPDRGLWTSTLLATGWSSCFQVGEPEVAHWHSLEGGFAGRRPLKNAERE
jgi:Fe-S cluster assembly iron-binding protein IscA